MRTTMGWIVAGAASMVLLCGLQSRAEAVPNSPPAGSPYTVRVATTASNTGPVTDSVLNNRGIYAALASTDASGSAVRLFAVSNPFFGFTFFDYYVRLPYRTSAGAPDTTYQVFDLKDNSGEFAGATENFTWVGSNNVRWYYVDYNVNGEFHYIYYTVDANNNPNQGSIVMAKATTAPDRCKIIADWGASQCPRDFEPIKEIPTEIKSEIIRAGWFGDTLNFLSDQFWRAANTVGKWVSDPYVQLVLVGVAGIATVLACCLPAAVALPVCALCATAALATMAAAGGAYLNTNPQVITNTEQLRSAGILACTGSSCRYQCVPWGTPTPTHETCIMKATSASACPAGWTFSSFFQWCSYTPF